MMRSNTYYAIRKAVRITFWIGVIGLMYLVATSVWWNEGGLCLGNVITCG